ncbi:MAG: bifunctional diaminohydroxyphosphoribosylaminopyrimidine deaminase/5-amino-6-(5-phosphoribosylamino)uracil reductase RibD [Aestuariivita sp.]|nr:bifunctional diaminohydroxyphosphoribosylaminopyrimidine deaminase/5-amino-6-(5-phosphoribosylamino)uracil reductase RibD [Aestuariivita sp.]
MNITADERWMRLALSLGRRCQGSTWPNPAVGCVIIKDDCVVGRGWTQPTGRPHAEVEALRRAGKAAKGATAYVSLEPCSHQGETPPCVNALLASGIKRVVAPINDCDSRVSGRGFDILRSAGVDITTGVCVSEAQKNHRGFFLRNQQGRPHITLKLASSLDGRIATAAGESRWITGPQARRFVHRMRLKHDAVMIGAGTARADDPSLTVREMGAVKQPVRIVVSQHLDIPLIGKLARSAHQVPVWLVHGKNADPDRLKAWKQLGARLFQCNETKAQLEPIDILKKLGEAGLTQVLCEGGSALSASLLSANLVDELVSFISGMTIGGDGLASVGAIGLDQLSDASQFLLDDVVDIAGDVMVTWSRKKAIEIEVVEKEY